MTAPLIAAALDASQAFRDAATPTHRANGVGDVMRLWDAMQVAEDTGRRLLLAGTFQLDAWVHPGNDSYRVCLPYAPIDVGGLGNDRTRLVVREKPKEFAGVNGARCAVIWPAKLSGQIGGRLHDLTVECQAELQLAKGTGSDKTDQTYVFSGIKQWRSGGHVIERVIVRNPRGTTGGGGPGETLGIDNFGSDGGIVRSSMVDITDAGDHASGIGYGACRGALQYDNVVVGRRRLVHGFPSSKGVLGARDRNLAIGCTATGFRQEFDEDCADRDFRAIDCGSGSKGHGALALKQSRRSVVVPELVADSRGAAVWVNNCLEYRVDLSTADIMGITRPDVEVGDIDTHGYTAGSRPLTTKSTGQVLR
jgi:hypothetical protein